MEYYLQVLEELYNKGRRAASCTKLIRKNKDWGSKGTKPKGTGQKGPAKRDQPKGTKTQKGPWPKGTKPKRDHGQKGPRPKRDQLKIKKNGEKLKKYCDE